MRTQTFGEIVRAVAPAVPGKRRREVERPLEAVRRASTPPRSRRYGTSGLRENPRRRQQAGSLLNPAAWGGRDRWARQGEPGYSTTTNGVGWWRRLLRAAAGSAGRLLTEPRDDVERVVRSARQRAEVWREESVSPAASESRRFCAGKQHGSRCGVGKASAAPGGAWAVEWEQVAPCVNGDARS